jgi:hypothetical protein
LADVVHDPLRHPLFRPIVLDHVRMRKAIEQPGLGRLGQ